MHTLHYNGNVVLWRSPVGIKFFFHTDLIMVVQVVSFSSSYPVRSSTPTMACLSTLPTTPTQFRSAQPLRSYTTTWSGLDLLGGLLAWLLLKASY